MEQVVTEWFCPSGAFRDPVVPYCALTLTQGGTNSEFRWVPYSRKHQDHDESAGAHFKAGFSVYSVLFCLNNHPTAFLSRWSRTGCPRDFACTATSFYGSLKFEAIILNFSSWLIINSNHQDSSGWSFCMGGEEEEKWLSCRQGNCIMVGCA